MTGRASELVRGQERDGVGVGSVEDRLRFGGGVVDGVVEDVGSGAEESADG